MNDSSENNDSEPRMPPHRIETLTDAIFALAMILMVLNLDPPPTNTDLTAAQLHKFLFDQADALFLFVITFLLLAFYWISSRQHSYYVRYTDQKYLWVHIIYLMFIVLVIYPNALSMYFPTDWMVQVMFSLNMFFIGILSFGNWVYATKDHRLVDPELDPKIIASVRKKMLVEPLVSLFAIVFSFTIPALWAAAFLLIPIIYIYLDKSN